MDITKCVNWQVGVICLQLCQIKNIYRKICSTNIELSVKTRINFFLSVLHTTRKKCALFPKQILAFRRKTNSEEWEWKSILEHDGTKLSQVFSLCVFVVFVVFVYLCFFF